MHGPIAVLIFPREVSEDEKIRSEEFPAVHFFCSFETS